MLVKTKNENLKTALILQIALALILLGWLLATAASGQTLPSETQSSSVQTRTETAPQTVLTPVFKNYKDVSIGLTAEEVKDKLGKAEVADKDGFFYRFSDSESAQIVLDADRKVRAILIFYKVNGGNAPKFEDVLGTDIKMEPNENGSIYKLVRYPEAGFWVAYNRTSGDNSMVSVTIQRL